MLFHKRLSFGSDHSGALFFFVTEVAVAPNKTFIFFGGGETLSPLLNCKTGERRRRR